jgi:urease accessory protein UreH
MTGTTYDGHIELVVQGRTWRRTQRPPLSLTVLDRGEGLLAIPTDQSGGSRGGDRLQTEVVVRAQGRLDWVAPASALYFPSADRQGVCVVRTRLEAGPGSRLAFVPKVGIPCAGARVDQVVEIEAASDSDFLYWDGWSDGRTASGERGAFASLANQLEFRLDGHLLFQERWNLLGRTSRSPFSGPDPAGFQGACQWFLGLAVGPGAHQKLLHRVEAWKAAGDPAEAGELAPGVWVARALPRRPRG